MAEDDKVYQMLDAVWRGACSCPSGKSLVTLNGVMRSAVYLAIRARMRFPGGLFRESGKDWGMSYWSDIPGWYTEAVAEGNVSACVAIETYLGRKPFLSPEGERLGLNSRFRWNGLGYRVTAWEADIIRAKFNQCTEAPKGKVLIKLTREQLDAARKANRESDRAIEKAAKEVERELLAAGWTKGAKYRGRPQSYLPPGDRGGNGYYLEQAMRKYNETRPV